MDPITMIAVAEGAITIIEKVAPLIQQAFQKGDITAEQQQTLLDRINALRSPDAFSDPSWKVE